MSAITEKEAAVAALALALEMSAPTENEYTAVGMALSQYMLDCPGKIRMKKRKSAGELTFTASPSPWSSKIFSMRNLWKK
ncbi:MAG: hypothetical protein KBS53_02510 [Bacteroidales bacterium]|nr:hypothetical protein [Candidatus Hennigimonas equi]